jgi:hypothetical protein
VPFDQFAPGALRPLVVCVEKIDSDNCPRRDLLLVVERPGFIVDDVEDRIRTICVFVEGVAVDEVDHISGTHVDLGGVLSDHVSLVLVRCAHATSNDTTIANDPTEYRRMRVHLTPFRPGSELLDEPAETLIGKPPAGA